jgi:hypothetical protein
MILSYSLDVRHVPLHILFFNFRFSYLNFISLLKSLSSLTKNPAGLYSLKNVPFFPKSDAVWDKFYTRIRVAAQAEKIINDKI